MLTGEASAGKSQIAREFAAMHSRPFFKFNCGMVKQLSQWWGSREIANGVTFYRPSALVGAFMTDQAVILLDELNRAETHLLNPLLELLDANRTTRTPEGLKVTVAPGVMIIATGNLGFEYSGTFEMDKALRDRFSTECWVALPSEKTVQQVLEKRIGCDQKSASELATLYAGVNSNKTLSYRISMRAIQEAATLIKYGMEKSQALFHTIVVPCKLHSAGDFNTLMTYLQGKEVKLDGLL